nr:hypothetical protein [Rhodopseudomonas sp. P2A-2r]
MSAIYTPRLPSRINVDPAGAMPFRPELRWAERALRTQSRFWSPIRRVAPVLGVALALALTPGMASAEGFFDFLFGGAPSQKQQPRRGAPPETNFFADPFGLNTPAAPRRRSVRPRQGLRPRFLRAHLRRQIFRIVA